MSRLHLRGIEPSTTDGDVATTVNGKTTWRQPTVPALPATAAPGDIPVVNDDGTTVWAPPPVPTPPAGTPEGYVPTTGADGTVTWGPAPATGSSTHREVVMTSGVTPPEPLVSSDGFDWLYGEASS